MRIQRELYDEEVGNTTYYNFVEQEIPFIDLPQGNYRFYLIAELTEQNDTMFVMLTPSEY